MDKSSENRSYWGEVHGCWSEHNHVQYGKRPRYIWGMLLFSKSKEDNIHLLLRFFDYVHWRTCSSILDVYLFRKQTNKTFSNRNEKHIITVYIEFLIFMHFPSWRILCWTKQRHMRWRLGIKFFEGLEILLWRNLLQSSTMRKASWIILVPPKKTISKKSCSWLVILLVWKNHITD